MIIRLLLFINCLLLVNAHASGQQPSNSGWLVVVNEHCDLTVLSQKQVLSLFLGRSHFLPTGSRVKTIDFPVDSKTRADFYLSLTGKNIADIDAYWARLRYSGRASPPQPLADSDAIIAMVQQQKSALAYLPSNYEGDLAANGLKAVLTVGVE